MAGHALQRSAFMGDNIFRMCVCGVKELNRCNSLSRYCLHRGQIHVHISPTWNLLNFCLLHSGILSSKQNMVNLMMPLQFPFRVQSSMKCCLITNSNQIICYSWYIPSRAVGALTAHLCVVNTTLGVTVSLSFHFMNSLGQRCWDRWGWEMDSAFFSSSAIILRHSPPPHRSPLNNQKVIVVYSFWCTVDLLLTFQDQLPHNVSCTFGALRILSTALCMHVSYQKWSCISTRAAAESRAFQVSDQTGNSFSFSHL